MDKIISAGATQCDFIHPGYGFLAENLELSELCREEGIVFVGPSPEVMKLSENQELLEQGKLLQKWPL